jgi:predicted nucleic acid-binding protein
MKYLVDANVVEHDLTLVTRNTRNVRDFRTAGVRVLDPFA